MFDWLQFVLAPQVINGLSIGVAVVLMALARHRWHVALSQVELWPAID